MSRNQNLLEKKLEPQVVEILGRNWLINELIKAGIEVAIPTRDRGIDLIAYLDREKSQDFYACPIQLKAASEESFSINNKYERTNNLRLVYVWYLQENKKTTAYAMTYQQTREIAEEKKYTETSSWRKGSYGTTKPGKELKRLLEKYEMNTEKWKSALFDNNDKRSNFSNRKSQ